MSAEDLGFVSDRLARIPAFIQANYLDNGKLPFASVLVGRGDDIALQWSSGVAEDAIFRIASMTKPITSVAFMQLVERGLVALTDPVTKYIPEFAQLGVFVGGGGNVPFMTRAPKTQMRVIDLLRHTAGFTYSFQEQGNIDAAYRKTDVESWTKNTSQSVIDTLAQIPLEFDPGTQWNYSVATDILGILVERISGLSLPEYFQTHIFTPLGMTDSFFQVPADKAARIPEGFAFDPETKMKLIDKAGADSMWAKGWSFNSGGGGLASSVADYYRFCRMLLNGGALDGAQILSPKTIELMTANHIPGGQDLTQMSKSLFSEAEMAGIGFGLGFATTIDSAATLTPCSTGDFYWGGMYSTAFFVDPVEDIIMIFMTQLLPSTTYPVRREIKTMIYSALAA
ncbi:MAG: beta-lactamase family protein [Sphingorhabdus sp.]|jgi:CubicO group peptidase (beta-lactamase class C family)|uniref:serine hydrolase domain-containing protein n=2 Tax=Sphingorhabdus sp. TaxID=1902408 RepID=UPI00273DB394|nr:serine hydrolase domain-containing protein [Sphingorhabdus sp.]MDP4757401.1 beta-lactamase family protein [Sphingorhabdus sp.]MDP4872687.1 beta-lactamase family protein [Sphingorhabdus sp.]MDP4927484.1 beta-lactamase family protein [Sphingorhabdus sp.]